MKIQLLIIGFLFCFSLGCTQTSKQAKQIDSLCEVINKDTLLRKKIYEAGEFMDYATDNGGELTVFHKNNQVYKIEEWIGLSSFFIVNTYYIQNNQLIFAKDEEFMYERHPVTGEIAGFSSQENLFKGKYYFKKGKLIHHESLGHNRFEDDEKNDAEKEFTTSVKKYLSLFYKK